MQNASFPSSWIAFALIIACLFYYFKDELPELLLPKWYDHDLFAPEKKKTLWTWAPF